MTVSGLFIAGVHAPNYELLPLTGLTAEVTQRPLTISGVTATDKVYDGSPSVLISGTATLVGGVSGDPVSLVTSGAVAIMADANIGASKPVAVSGYSLAGLSSTNYSLIQPGSLVATVTQKPLTIGGLFAVSRNYNGSTVAALTGTPFLIGVVDGDDVVLSGAGVSAFFGGPNAGSSKPVTVTGYTLSGVSSGNYILSQPLGITADIYPISQTITFGELASKIYGDAPFVLGGTASSGLPVSYSVVGGSSFA
ncbi:MAG: filamentous hemagglutinin, partial [Verrucomicrobia bacterium]|nr:filamentous hemagglutinin [Verrucomicrobiota bacterium]